MTRLRLIASASLIATTAVVLATPALAQSTANTAKPATAPAATTKPISLPATTPKPATAATTTTGTASATTNAAKPATTVPAASSSLATVGGSAPAATGSTTTASVTAPSNVQIPTDIYMWVKMCTPDDKTKKETCTTTQRLLSETGAHVVTATFREVTGDPKTRQLMISGPLGVQLAPGLKAAVDGGKVLSMNYALCFVDGCYAQTAVDDAFVKSLKAGKKLNITVVSPDGKTVQVPLTLSGFGKVYDAKGVTPEAAKIQFDLLAAAAKAKGAETSKVQ
jgi:invasion protein IalB